MKISKWPAKKNPYSPPGQMIRVTKKEAMRLIESLAAQLYTSSCNSKRAEFDTDKGEYFSIAVNEVE